MAFLYRGPDNTVITFLSKLVGLSHLVQHIPTREDGTIFMGAATAADSLPHTTAIDDPILRLPKGWSRDTKTLVANVVQTIVTGGLYTKELMIINSSEEESVFLEWTGNPATLASGWELEAGSSIQFDGDVPTGLISAIAAGAAEVRIRGC